MITEMKVTRYEEILEFPRISSIKSIWSQTLIFLVFAAWGWWRFCKLSKRSCSACRKRQFGSGSSLGSLLGPLSWLSGPVGSSGSLGSPGPLGSSGPPPGSPSSWSELFGWFLESMYLRGGYGECCCLPFVPVNSQTLNLHWWKGHKSQFVKRHWMLYQ